MKVYLTTSDSYCHLVGGFAYLFNKYWSPRQEVVILCYKKPNVNLPKNFKIHSLGKQPSNGSWTDGLIDFFNKIKDEYFTLIMDDCYIIEKINLQYIKILESYFSENNVAKIDLTNDRFKHKHKEYARIGDLEIIESEQDAQYRSSTQIAIWRKNYFLKILKPNRNPWQFELIGQQELMNDGKIILGTKNHIIKNIEIMVEGQINTSTKGICNIKEEDLFFMRNNNLISF